MWTKTAVRLRLAVAALAAVVVAAAPGVDGSVDEFQCVCAYNARQQVTRVRGMLGAGLSDQEAVDYTASCGPLATRMLLVAYGRPDTTPAAGWLWLWNLYANTVAERAPENHGRPVTDGVDRVYGALAEYATICWAQGVETDAASWTQQAFEKYVLEKMTSIVQQPPDGVKAGSEAVPIETDFQPRLLYMNHVAAVADGPDKLLAQGVGIDWDSAAVHLRHVYGLSTNHWMTGIGELVLYQREVASMVATSMMGFVSVHVSLCRDYWGSAPPADTTEANDGGPVAEYSRVWMSIGDLLRSFGAYLDASSEKYFRTLLDVAANPALEEAGFRRARRAIEASVEDVSRGRFRVQPAKPREEAAAAAAAAEAAAAAADAKDNKLNELIALVDSNISSAGKYLKTVQDLLSGVDFRIINNFMRSTHIWLT